MSETTEPTSNEMIRKFLLFIVLTMLTGAIFYVAYHSVEPLFHRWLAPEFYSITYIQCCSLFILTRFVVMFLIVPIEVRKKEIK
jgi:predicted secreted protein